MKSTIFITLSRVEPGLVVRVLCGDPLLEAFVLKVKIKVPLVLRSGISLGCLVGREEQHPGEKVRS